MVISRVKRGARAVLVLALPVLTVTFLGGFGACGEDAQCEASELSVADTKLLSPGEQFDLFSPPAGKSCVQFELKYEAVGGTTDNLSALTPIFHVDNETVVIPNSEGTQTSDGFTLSSHGDYHGNEANPSVVYYVRLTIPAFFQNQVQVAGKIKYVAP